MDPNAPRLATPTPFLFLLPFLPENSPGFFPSGPSNTLRAHITPLPSRFFLTPPLSHLPSGVSFRTLTPAVSQLPSANSPPHLPRLHSQNQSSILNNFLSPRLNPSTFLTKRLFPLKCVLAVFFFFQTHNPPIVPPPPFSFLPIHSPTPPSVHQLLCFFLLLRFKISRVKLGGGTPPPQRTGGLFGYL